MSFSTRVCPNSHGAFWNPLLFSNYTLTFDMSTGVSSNIVVFIIGLDLKIHECQIFVLILNRINKFNNKIYYVSGFVVLNDI